MYHAAGVEVTEALSDVRKLVTGVSAGKNNRRDTYEYKSVRIGVFLDVLR